MPAFFFCGAKELGEMSDAAESENCAKLVKKC
jgi:hypothetical protein